MISLSIIIPHYNSVNSLKKLLESIPVRNDIEIIIVDDNSSENLKELYLLVSECEQKNINLYQNNTNKKGAGVCRNIGMLNARGNWLLFADADDFFIKDFYEKIKGYLNSDYEVVFFTPTSIEEDTGNLSNRHVTYEKLNYDFLVKQDKVSELSLRYRYNVPWSKLIKSSFIKSNKIFFDEVIASNDIMFSTKIGYYMQNFYISREVIYCVTKSKGTLTTKTSEVIYNARLEVYINYCNFLRGNLNTKDYKLLKINGLPILIRAIQYKYSLRKVFSIYRKLNKNKINIIDRRLLNPLFIIRKSFKYIKTQRFNKRFLTK